MSHENDRTDPETQDLVEYVNELFDDLYLLASEVALYSEEEIPSELHERILDLESEFMELDDVQFHFSGRGYVPVILPDGDEDTIYSYVQCTSGQFVGLELIDGEDIEYMTEDDLTSDAEESGSLLEDDAVFARFAKMMHEPPNETRLHIQFLVDSHENQTEIGGGMVKADGVSYYAMMDAEKVTLDSVEELAKAEITVDNIEEALHEASRQMHNLVKSTPFRRSKLRHQRALVDELLSDIDSTLQIDRFKMYVRPTEFFVPDTSNENHSIVGYSCKDTVSGFSVEPIRVETLNSFALMGGTRITSDRQVVYPNNSGVCVVAEIDDHVRDFYSLPCNVIWIPVAFPITNHKTSTPGFRAHFEE